MNNGGESVFAQYVVVDNSEKQLPTVPNGPALAHSHSHPAQRLLAWLLTDWSGTTVGLRDICRFGPYDLRDRKGVLELAEVLTKSGWLAPMVATRRNSKKWLVIPKAPTGSPLPMTTSAPL
jgi:hypothetical protein